MASNKKPKSDLYELVNLGESCVLRMEAVGIRTIKQFQKIGPEKTYQKCCKKQGSLVHRAFLYVLRSAHFYAYNRDKRDQARLWWLFRKPGEGGTKRQNY